MTKLPNDFDSLKSKNKKCKKKDGPVENPSNWIRISSEPRQPNKFDGLSADNLRKAHLRLREYQTKGLYRTSINDLIKAYFLEMDAKNNAYYFIIENGYLDEYIKYCDEQGYEKCLIDL